MVEYLQPLFWSKVYYRRLWRNCWEQFDIFCEYYLYGTRFVYIFYGNLCMRTHCTHIGFLFIILMNAIKLSNDFNGPLARYAKPRVAYAPGIPAVMYVGIPNYRFPFNSVAAKHSRRMRNPQLYVFGRRFMTKNNTTQIKIVLILFDNVMQRFVSRASDLITSLAIQVTT